MKGFSSREASYNGLNDFILFSLLESMFKVVSLEGFGKFIVDTLNKLLLGDQEFTMMGSFNDLFLDKMADFEGSIDLIVLQLVAERDSTQVIFLLIGHLVKGFQVVAIEGAVVTTREAIIIRD